VSALPGFVFSAFDSVGDKQFQGWAAFRESIQAGTRLDGTTVPLRPGARPPAESAGPLGIWRLLASNNRELGRSGRAYPSFEAAREHVLRLQQVVDDLVVVGVRGAASSQYGWIATLGDVPVVTSGRWFGASSTSMHSAATTLAAFETAIVSDEVWVGSHSAARGSRRGLVATSTW
jgi:hypothetical protein